MILDKLGILAELALKTEVVSLGTGDVIVAQIGAADYMGLWTDPDNHTDGKLDQAKLMPKIVAYTVVDANGNRIFTDAEAVILSRSAIGPFGKLSDAAKRLNGLAGDEIKNSEPSLAESSSSDSV